MTEPDYTAATFLAAELSFTPCGRRGAWLRDLIRHGAAALAVIDGEASAHTFVAGVSASILNPIDKEH